MGNDKSIVSGKNRLLVNWVRTGFSDNPARLINLARIALALASSALFALASPPGTALLNGVFALLAVYSVFAVCTAVVGTRSWWMGARLAPINSLADWGMFLALLLLADGYECLCFPFFLLLLVSSGHRLGWGRTFVVGLALGLLLVGVLHIVTTDADPLALMHLFLRMVALAMLALLIAFFYGRTEPESQMAGWRESLLQEAMRESELPLPLILARIEALFAADRIIFAWRDVGAGRSRMVVYERDEPNERSCTTEEFSRLQQLGVDGEGSFLFDGDKGHVLARLPDGHSMPIAVGSFAKLIDPPLTTGICVTIVCQAAVGRLFVIRERGVSESDFRRVEAVSAVMEAVLNRYQLVEAIRENAFSRAQLEMARNIHDGVVQNLAGFGMRFAAMKLDLMAGRVTETLDELDKLQSLVKEEQLGLRALIRRDQESTEDRCNVVPLLRELALALAQQWSIQCSVSAFPDPIMIPARFGSEVNFLVREAVANAARHARASWVRVSVAIDDTVMRLLITSDRNIEGKVEAPSKPRSLAKRVEGLGGAVMLKQKTTGTQLTASLPIRGELTWRGY